MTRKHVDGADRGEVILYALSTCAWCNKTKRLLKELGVAYDFIDVDLLDRETKKEVVKEVRRWNPRTSYPTLVINNQAMISGYDESRIRELLEK